MQSVHHEFFPALIQLALQVRALGACALAPGLLRLSSPERDLNLCPCDVRLHLQVCTATRWCTSPGSCAVACWTATAARTPPSTDSTMPMRKGELAAFVCWKVTLAEVSLPGRLGIEWAFSKPGVRHVPAKLHPQSFYLLSVMYGEGFTTSSINRCALTAACVPIREWLVAQLVECS